MRTKSTVVHYDATIQMPGGCPCLVYDEHKNIFLVQWYKNELLCIGLIVRYTGKPFIYSITEEEFKNNYRKIGSEVKIELTQE